MIQIPEQVKDAPVVRMKNAVLVGTMKFTLDRFDASFDAEENPAPPRLAAQLAEFRASYEALNTAYAQTRESLITQDIAALDEEGDQLYLGLKESGGGYLQPERPAPRCSPKGYQHHQWSQGRD